MTAPGSPYVVVATDGIRAIDVETVTCLDLVTAALSYARLAARYTGRRYIVLGCYSEGGHDYDTDGLESEEREAIESGDAEFARRTLEEMGWADVGEGAAC